MGSQTEAASPLRLQVFLCYSSSNKSVVQDLHQRLKACNGDSWFEKKKFLGGQEWELEIHREVKRSDAIIELEPTSLTHLLRNRVPTPLQQQAVVLTPRPYIAGVPGPASGLPTGYGTQQYDRIPEQRFVWGPFPFILLFLV
jgi:hypothetical protein